MPKIISYKLTKCPYCGANIELKDSVIIYGKSYGMVYVCENYPKCDAYVGCHPGTIKALGRLANKELRFKKKLAHKYFDGLWKTKKKQGDRSARQKGYRWLASQLGLPLKETHIGWFDIETCDRVIKICKKYYK